MMSAAEFAYHLQALDLSEAEAALLLSVYALSVRR
jgi:hypothetical protein